MIVAKELVEFSCHPDYGLFGWMNATPNRLPLELFIAVVINLIGWVDFSLFKTISSEPPDISHSIFFASPLSPARWVHQCAQILRFNCRISCHAHGTSCWHLHGVLGWCCFPPCRADVDLDVFCDHYCADLLEYSVIHIASISIWRFVYFTFFHC